MIDRQLEGEKCHLRNLDTGCGSVKIGVGALTFGRGLYMAFSIVLSVFLRNERVWPTPGYT